ncbi:Alpha/Beta hydrolase protein [Hygrophoropsis aurantiaca]|uniref:Alpha/Beta hydrolase protein n=1 Tax=Hygrophoropsis aurantiaca TaxID=72124 RepID=A0ACB8A1Q4_9AGAM|nr:Alpha/Beta hydrolase protein [Hygrophoropsis aurantiaca]
MQQLTRKYDYLSLHIQIPHVQSHQLDDDQSIVSTDKTVLHAEAVRDPNNPSVVFVHGLGLSSAIFDNLFKDDRLLAKLHLVRYDMPGHGLSGKPVNEASHASALYAQHFSAVMKVFNLNKPFQFGWSLGGTVAADMCASVNPIPVHGVISLAGVPYIGALGEIGTSTIKGLLPGLLTKDDVLLAMNTRIAFVENAMNSPKQDHRDTWQ